VSDAIGDPFAPLPARLVSSRESSRVVSVPLVKPVGAAGIEPAHPKRQAEIIEESATVRALNTPDGAGCEASGDDSLDDSFFAALVEHQARAEAYQALSRPAKRRVKVAEIRRRRKGVAHG